MSSIPSRNVLGLPQRGISTHPMLYLPNLFSFRSIHISVSWDAKAAKIRGDSRLISTNFASFTKSSQVRGTFFPGWFFSICAMYLLILAMAAFSAEVMDSFVVLKDTVLSRAGFVVGVSPCSKVCAI